MICFMKSKLFVPILLAASAAAMVAQSEPPIACNLRALTLDQRKELSAVGKRAVMAITGSRDLPDGYAFRIDPERASIRDIAEWLDLWRRCCPFYEFRIDLHGADASMWLSVTGRKGVKEYLPVDAPSLASKLPR